MNSWTVFLTIFVIGGLPFAIEAPVSEKLQNDAIANLKAKFNEFRINDIINLFPQLLSSEVHYKIGYKAGEPYTPQQYDLSKMIYVSL